MNDHATRYDRVASLLHWLIGLALLGQITFGFLLDDIAPRATPARGAVINLHKSLGLMLGAAIVLRLLWRLWHRPPAWPTGMSERQRSAARLGHRVLYACMLVMPVSGYIASNFSKHGIKLFGMPLAPWGPDLPIVYSAFNLLHLATAWVFTGLIAGHIVVAFKHAVVDRDAIFTRIAPWSSSTASPTRHANQRETA